MPVNLNALGVPGPDEEGDARSTAEAAAEEDAAPKRRRRSKAELIADAVVPADDERVLLKDVGTGAKIERSWLVAVEMVKDGKAEWADKAMKFSLLKYEQQKSAPAFTQEPSQVEGETRYDPQQTSHVVKREEFVDHGTPYVRVSDIFGGHEGTMTLEEWNALPVDREPDEQPASDAREWDESGHRLAPEGAELGDEVVVGSETYVVGHGNRLVQGMVSADGEVVVPKRRWQRELGAGPDGPWQSRVLNQGTVTFSGPGGQETVPGTAPIEEMYQAMDKAITSPQNGSAGIDVETERLPRTVEPVEGTNTIRIGTGILEKIGLPQVEQYAGGSQLQVGPITLSRLVVDDGRRETVSFADGREGEIISAAAEGFELLDNTAEFIAARFRGQLQSFLALVGVLKQPVA
jgi:hypothetical protein